MCSTPVLQECHIKGAIFFDIDAIGDITSEVITRLAQISQSSSIPFSEKSNLKYFTKVRGKVVEI